MAVNNGGSYMGRCNLGSSTTPSAGLRLMLLCTVWACSARLMGRQEGRTPRAHESGDQDYLLFYFVRNGELGLRIAHSLDGRTFTPVNNGRGLLRPEVAVSDSPPLMRDPSVTQTPDGVFHLVWTVAWNAKGFGYTTSRDLIHFEKQVFVDCMGEQSLTRNVWAPDISYDVETGLLNVVWASTIRGHFPETAGSSENGYNHRLYFTTFAPGAGALEDTLAEARLLYEPGYNVIDGNLATDGHGTHLLFFKDERRHPHRKCIKVASSQTGPLGPYGAPSEPLVEGLFWAEGPTAVHRGGTWTVYFEKYATIDEVQWDGSVRDEHVHWTVEWGAVQSHDLRSWRDVSGELRFPKGARHGTVLAVTPDIVRGLLDFHGHHNRRDESLSEDEL